METKHLKSYAPQARRDFIEAVTNKAAVYGLLPNEVLPMREEGDVVIIGDRPFPRSVAKQRKELEARLHKDGFQQFIEAIAYTWFNRFVAIRYMELHGYLDHGYRVLSHPEGKSTPEIVENAERIELPSLNRDEVVDLKLDGGKDEQLYQTLLLAQCNALYKSMPFLFESIKEGTELLLPDNLLHTDSLVRTLVNGIPEEQWQEVEIIGWLYQFYISEKKDEVIGKVIKSEDIPAATQLFTPNWIVKYLVQNSLGRQWVATYPDSPLKQQMGYYIEAAEQTPEVQQQLDEITPDSLNPEEITLLDPACGSGHILVEAYDLFRAIYQERGYRARDIPTLILTKNLFGLEIDERAAQLAAFSLVMKARADDRAIFGRDIRPHVLAIQASNGLDAREITGALNHPLKNGIPGDLHEKDVTHLIDLFKHGKTFGSLIRVPATLAEKLTGILQRVEDVISHGGMFEQVAAMTIRPFLEQARILAGKYDAVAANPPYMGRKYHNITLKDFAKEHYPDSHYDLFAAFIEQGFSLAKEHGWNSMVAMHSWMFLSTFRTMRERILSAKTIGSLAHLGARAFGAISGEVVQTAAFSCLNRHIKGFAPSFLRLTDGDEAQKRDALAAKRHLYSTVAQDRFLTISGGPIAYWIGEAWYRAFEKGTPLGEILHPRQGLATGDNDRFLRCWHEVNLNRIAFGLPSRDEAARSGAKWFPYNKGGAWRKWYGNHEFVVNWYNDGEEIRNHFDNAGKLRSRPQNTAHYFKEGITWSDITTSDFAARYAPQGAIFDVKGSSGFGDVPLIVRPEMVSS